jgi:hypothetical protein
LNPEGHEGHEEELFLKGRGGRRFAFPPYASFVFFVPFVVKFLS